MSEAELVESSAVRRRRWRTVEGKRRSVEATLIEGASVSHLARLNGVNNNQVFHWRRQYRAGELSLPDDSPIKGLPVAVSDAPESREEIPNKEPVKRSGGLIHIEFPGGALVSIERSRSSIGQCCTQETDAVIELPKGTRIWLGAGATDLRRDFDVLSTQVQHVLQKEPLSGHVFVFRGRRGDRLS